MDLFSHGIQQPTSKQTSSLSTIQFLWCQFGEFGIESINNPQIDIFLFNITSMLVVHWSWRKKVCLGQVKNNDLVLPQLSFLQAWSCGAFYFIRSYLSFSDRGSVHGEWVPASCWLQPQLLHQVRPKLCKASEQTLNGGGHPASDLRWMPQSASRHGHMPCSGMMRRPAHPVTQ